MAKPKSNRLWSVYFNDEYYPRRNYRVHGDINTNQPVLIIATSNEIASNKAKRWLKQNKKLGYTVGTVEFSGTIAAF